ncbi:MAG TPA: chromate transporter [Bdellovibrionales bacterium]|nr:chromate transporter [Bdellovibrionales bacterium]
MSWVDLDIFWVFFKIGFLSFGGVFGVLPELERLIVADRGWITHDQFIQSYVIGQFLPGPNMVMCPIIGYWVNGYSGLAAGFLGIYSAPLIIMGATYAIYNRSREIGWIRRTERSLRPLVFGLLLSAALKLVWLQTTGTTGAHPGVFRAIGMTLTMVAAVAAVRFKLGGLSLVFMTGAVWWLTNWVALLQ